MLRVMGEGLRGVVGYDVPKLGPKRREEQDEGEEVEEGEGDGEGTMREVLDWLDDLERGWEVVLQGQVWDPASGQGVDLVLPSGSSLGSGSMENMSQTERIRLKSLLIGGSTGIEEWVQQGVGDNAEYTDELEGMFESTMRMVGGLEGVGVGGETGDPDGMVGTC